MIESGNIVIISFEILLSLIFLIWAADRFIIGAVIIANRLRVTPLLIGLTIVAIGTSAPEIFVAILSAINGSPEIGVGNALGSNIANIGLVLGVTALLGTIHVSKGLVTREIPIFIIVTIFSTVVLWNRHIGKTEGAILLSIYLISFAWLIWRNLHSNDTIISEEVEEVKEKIDTTSHKLPVGIFWLIFGLALLPISSHFLVSGAVDMARWFNIDEFIIGLTIIAVGTSLPELVTSLISMVKGHHDIAIGNILGSNIANLTLVLGPIGLIRATELPNTLNRDLVVMVVLSLSIILMAFRKKKTICKLEGSILLASFIGYIVMVVINV